MLKVGLIGAGSISGAHIPVWEALDFAELVCICDSRKENLDKFPQKRCYTDLAEMLDREELDILDICVPTFAHVDCALQALNRGVHVLCEKPLSLNPEDADRVYDAARKNGVFFMVAQVLRFWREYEILRDLIVSQKYGKLLSLHMSRLFGLPEWTVGNWSHDESKSGLTPFDVHVHDLDFLVWALGEPKQVTRHRTKGPGRDYIHAVYEFEDCFATADAAFFAAPGYSSVGYRAQFERAVAEKTDTSFLIWQADGTQVDLDEKNKEAGIINLPATDAFQKEIGYFAACVRDGVAPDLIRQEQVAAVLHLCKGFQEL